MKPPRIFRKRQESLDAVTVAVTEVADSAQDLADRWRLTAARTDMLINVTIACIVAATVIEAAVTLRRHLRDG